MQAEDNDIKPVTAIIIQYLSRVMPSTVDVSGAMDPEDGAAFPDNYPSMFVQVNRLGGVRTNVVTDSPMIYFGCYAESDAKAEVLCVAVANWLERLPELGAIPYWYTDLDGTRVNRRAWFTRHNQIGGPVRNPDPKITSRKRWTTTVQLSLSTNIS